MPCYKPMLAYPSFISHETGKVQYRFKSNLVNAADVSEVVRLEDGNLYPVKALPCGKCIGCRLDYSREWAVRCTLELQDHDPAECFFVTLTYDDAHVPYSLPEVVYTYVRYPQSWANPDGTEFYYKRNQKQSNMTLRPEDLQAFLKRIRSWQKYTYGKEIRFYACGEYGSKTARPHYHLIIYGMKLKPPENNTWKTIQNGNTIWECKELMKYWKNGRVHVGNVSFESCGYVARYMLKKKKGSYGEFYKTFNIVPEFTRMSLKPGIGQKYYEENKLDIYKNDEIFISTEKKGIKVKPPRYFDIRAADELPGLFDELKEERSDLAYWNMVAKEEKSGLNISQVLLNEEEARKFKTKILQERNVGNEA